VPVWDCAGDFPGRGALSTKLLWRGGRTVHSIRIVTWTGAEWPARSSGRPNCEGMKNGIRI
jgi:hypothetical protein